MKRLGKVLLWLVVCVLAVVLSVSYHLSTQVARDKGRDLLNAYVSGEMRGTLEIGSFESLGLWGGVATDVDLIDPEGRVVLHAERVVIALDLAQLRDGVLRFPHGRVRGGEVHLYPDEEGIPSFIHVFEAAEPSGDPPSPDGIIAIVDDLDVEGMTVDGDILGLEGLRVEDLRARGRLAINSRVEHPVDIRVYSGSGRMTAPFPYDVDLSNIVGRIQDDPAEGTRFHVSAATDRDEAHANVVYRIPEGGSEEELDLLIRADPVYAETVAGAGMGWAETFVGPVRGTIRLQGPPDNLSLRASLETEGGHLDVEGQIPAGERTSVQLRTGGLHLDRVIPGAPPLEVQGSFELEAGDETEVVVDLDPFRYAGVEVPSSRVRGTFEDDRFVVHDAEVPVAGGGTLRASGVVGYEGDIELRVEGSVRQIGREPNLRRWIPGATGSVTVRSDVRIDEEGRMDIRGRWVFVNPRYGPAHASMLVAEGRIGGTTDAPTVNLGLSASSVDVYDTALGDGTGRVSGGPQRFQVATDLRHPERRVSLAGAATLLASGFRADLSELTLGAGPTTWRGQLAGLLMVGSTLEVASFALASGSQSISGSGRWRQRRDLEDELHLRANDVDLDSLWAWLETPPDIAGRVTGTADIGGDLEAQPTVDVDLLISGGRILDAAGVDGSVLARYREGVLEADAGLTIEGGGELDISVRGAFDREMRLRDAYRDGAYESTVRMRDVDLGLLRALRVEGLPDLEGRAAGEVKLSGALDFFDFEGEIEIPSLTIDEFPAFGIKSHFAFQDGVIVARATTRDEGGDLVEAEGSVLLDLISVLEEPDLLLPMLQASPWRVSLRMPPRELGTLPAPIAAQIPGAEVLRGSGSLSIRGGAYRPHADLLANVEYAGELRDAPCATEAMPRAEIRGELRGDQTQARVVGFLGGQQVLQGAANAITPLDQWLRDPDSFALPSTSVEAFVVRAAVEQIPGACVYGSGTVTAAVHVNDLFGAQTTADLQLYSDEAHARRLEIRGRGERRRVEVREQTPASRIRLKASLANGVATTDGRVEWWNGGESRFAGELPMLWGGENVGPALPENAELFAFADFYDMPIRAALTWLDAVGYVEGGLYGNVVAEGPLENPTLSGELELADGGFEVPSVGQRLQDVTGTFLFEDDRVTLQNVRARDGDGVTLVAGDVTLAGIVPKRADLRLDATGFPIRQEGSVLANLDGSASIEAEFLEGELAGQLRVERLHVRLAEDLGRTPQDLARHPDIIVLGEEVSAPVGDPYRISLHVDATTPFQVKHDDFAANVSAELDVLYADPRFDVSGRVELGSGHFDVFGKRFEVERGNMIFLADRGFDPDVNLVAIHELRSNETITVTASGRLSDPQIRFSSSVTNDRAEIVALLVSGDVRRDTNAEAERAPTDFLVGIAAGVLTLSLREQFGAAVPSIIFESNQFGGARIRGGWRIDEVLPERLRRVIQGIYIEGF
ncbi:MAG: translocation/assembly module TamB domain-containing protein, partial [Myxococcota bacterium]